MHAYHDAQTESVIDSQRKWNDCRPIATSVFNLIMFHDPCNDKRVDAIFSSAIRTDIIYRSRKPSVRSCPADLLAHQRAARSRSEQTQATIEKRKNLRGRQTGRTCSCVRLRDCIDEKSRIVPARKKVTWQAF